MPQSNILIIFAKNPVAGKVKTRLAATVGPEKALEVYLQLLQHTKNVVQRISADNVVFYADHLAPEDDWGDCSSQAVQHGSNLGERMQEAFSSMLQKGYAQAVLIGTDCPELTSEILEKAFANLATHDVVIGPAHDGGYYLIGMKAVHPELFQSVAWSTSSVLETTVAKCQQNQLSYALLPTLHDVDEEKDLVYLSSVKA